MGVSRRVLLVIVIVLALAGGGIAAGILLTEGGSSGGESLKPRYHYPQKAKDQLLAACEVKSEKSTCECVVRAYEATMPYDVYTQITSSGVQLNTTSFFRAFTQAASGCSH